MAPRLMTASLDEATLRQTLTAYNTLLTTIYLESETRVVLSPLGDFLGPKITLPPVRWLIGRAFGPALEIRWHVEGDQFEATALTESGAGPDDWQPSQWNTLLDPTTHPRDVLLVGVNTLALPPDHIHHNAQPDGGLWIDTRIPRPLYYPAPDPKAQRVVLRCLDYLSHGLVVITRLCGLASYNP
ncbi:MAG: hypothetical protein IT324_04750 [Anaerolineae bacterium]|nr:hypothetical protein [Anaerolineae bacterium]